MKKWTFILYGLIIFSALSCSKEDEKLTPAIIIGYDLRLCACCGGLMVDLGDDNTNDVYQWYQKNDEFAEFLRIKQKFLAKDKYNQLVFLADSDFSIQMTQQKYPSVKLFFTSEFD